MSTGPFAARCAQASRRFQSCPCTHWTPQPGTLQGGVLWAEQGMGQVERGWGVYFNCCHPARRCREPLSLGTGVGTCESRGVRRKPRAAGRQQPEDVCWEGGVPQRKPWGAAGVM